jgi:hypothetical protein
MRFRTGLLICCPLLTCTGLAACTAGAPKGPDVTVSTPSVGRPAPPSSVQAALSRMAYTPYAALGQSNNDGLAPNESSYALAQACLNLAGYPGAGNVPFAVSLGPANLSFAQPWGAWGYLGIAAAQQYGFRAPAGSALSTLGIDVNPAPSNPADLPQAEQTAIGKCSTISQEFTDAVGKGPLAGILTLSNDIANDVRKDGAVMNATQQWSACMARNGYTYGQPQNVFFDQIHKMFGGKRQISFGDTVSTAANQAQIAAAVTDATCTESADLAGIYLAVQASYEQQIVNANQQRLTSAVRQYKALYAMELKKLPSLLKTAKANAFPRPVPISGAG